MLKNHIAACLMATALVAAPAMAQTQPATPPAAGETTQPRPLEGAPADTQAAPGAPATDAPAMDAPAGDTAQQPATEAPATDTAQQPAMDAPATDTAQQPVDATTDMAAQEAPGADLQLEGGVIAMQNPDHIMANDLIGVNVVGADDQTIGSVKDLVLDGENRVVGVIVGVGGFLGIGEKEVGLPMQELNIVPDVDATAAVGTGEASAREIDEIRVMMTREQLDEAPAFSRLEPPAPATEPGAAPGMGGGMGGGGMGQPN